MNNHSHNRPLPSITLESAPYWDGLRQGKLLLQRCSSCGKFRHYPRLVCDTCHSMKVDWVESTGQGEIYSWTIAHQAFHESFKADIPYVLAIAILREGVRVQARLNGVAHADIRVGLPVVAKFEKITDDLTLLALVPSVLEART